MSVGAPLVRSLQMSPVPLNRHFDDYLYKSEVSIYIVLAVLLSVTALVTMAGAGQMLWQSVIHWTVSTEILRVLDQLLLVLMLLEILYTVRITVRSHIVLAAEVSVLTRAGKWSSDGESIFLASMVELGLLVTLILVLVVSIMLLRRYVPDPEEKPLAGD